MNRNPKRGRDHYNFKHGHSPCTGSSPEYRSWRAMLDRCFNPRCPAFRRYGGRGIGVCDQWRSDFVRFLKDVGSKPSLLHTLDRFPDNDGDYEPGNVRWATALEQGRNRRTNVLLTYAGITMCLVEWAEHVGLEPSTLQHRLARYGWPLEEALGTPTRRDPISITLGGETASSAEWARRLGIPASTIVYRIRHGWSDAETLAHSRPRLGKPTPA